MKQYKVQMIGMFFVLIVTITAQAAYLGTSRLSTHAARFPVFGSRTLFNSWLNKPDQTQLPVNIKPSVVRLDDQPIGTYVIREEIDNASMVPGYVPIDYYRGIRTKENPPGIPGMYNPFGIVRRNGTAKGYGIEEEVLYVHENPSNKQGKPHLIRIVKDPNSGKVYREEVYTNASTNQIETIAKEYLERQDRRLKQMREKTISTLPQVNSKEIISKTTLFRDANAPIEGTFADIVDKTKKYLKELSRETIESFKSSARRIRRALYGPEE